MILVIKSPAVKAMANPKRIGIFTSVHNPHCITAFTKNQGKRPSIISLKQAKKIYSKNPVFNQIYPNISKKKPLFRGLRKYYLLFIK